MMIAITIIMLLLGFGVGFLVGFAFGQDEDGRWNG